MHSDWSVQVQTQKFFFVVPLHGSLHSTACWVRQDEKGQIVQTGLRKKRPIEFQSCGNDEDKCQPSRKCWACRYIGQTHPYIHILKSGLMSTATIKSVLSEKALALWPSCWRSESNDAVLLRAIKQGGGNCRGQSYSEVESPHVLKRLPPSVCPHFGIFSLLQVFPQQQPGFPDGMISSLACNLCHLSLTLRLNQLVERPGARWM